MDSNYAETQENMRVTASRWVAYSCRAAAASRTSPSLPLWMKRCIMKAVWSCRLQLHMTNEEQETQRSLCRSRSRWRGGWKSSLQCSSNRRQAGKSNFCSYVFFLHDSLSGLYGQQVKQSWHSVLQLVLRDPVPSTGQVGYVVPAVCSESASRSPLSRTCPEYTAGFDDQIPKPPVN